MTGKTTNAGKELERRVAEQIRLADEPSDFSPVVSVLWQPETQQAISPHQPRDAYSPYEIGLCQLLGRLGQYHSRYSEALVYQQRLSENIAQVRRHGDTDVSRTERSRIIEQLNELALSVLEVSFNELCGLSPKPPPYAAPVTVLIPAGTFWMGSPADDPEAQENEKPRRPVDLSEYQISRYPVTNTQYACFVLDAKYSLPEHWDAAKAPAGLEDHPVVNVSYEDAEAYCRWLSQVTGQHYRLPAEEEWEKAARGSAPEARRYPWGSEWRPGCCNTRELGRNGTTSVHEFEQTSQSPFGVVDMAGNVWEWTSSWYERYPGSSHESLHYGRLYRVVRGGSWRNSCREACVSCRGRYKPGMRRTYLGFRIVSD